MKPSSRFACSTFSIRVCSVCYQALYHLSEYIGVSCLDCDRHFCRQCAKPTDPISRVKVFFQTLVWSGNDLLSLLEFRQMRSDMNSTEFQLFLAEKVSEQHSTLVENIRQELESLDKKYAWVEDEESAVFMYFIQQDIRRLESIRRALNLYSLCIFRCGCRIYDYIVNPIDE